MGQHFLRFLVEEFGKGIVLAVASLATYRILLLIDRRRKLRFFGISSRVPQLTVYLSRLVVERATGVRKVGQGYRGPAVQKSELNGAVLVRDLLKAGRVAVLPQGIRDRLGRWFVSIAPVEPAIEVSPAELRQLGDLPRQNVVSLGSHVYNSLFCEHNKQSRCFRFERRGGVRGVAVLADGAHQGLFLTRDRPPGPGEIGIIERVNDPSGPRTVFYCAGLGASATMGSVRYLVEHWEELLEHNGLEEFALFLVFRGQPLSDTEETVVQPQGPVYVKRGTPLSRWRLS